MQLAEAFIRITAKDAEWKKGIANIQAEVTKVTKSMGEKFEAVGKRMSDVGKNLSLKVTAPLVAMGAGAVKLGMDFEAAMSEVGAISGATGNDFKALEEKAKELGASTKFSSSEAAEGLKYMAMAGWDTQKMLDGLPGILKLAAASGEELGTVSDIVTDAMTAFGMEASRAAEFADTLAAASSKSNTNVAMLGESFKYVAPVAGALGYSSKDTAVALGLMANAGIKGSQSGTSLRATISRLIKPMGDGEKIMNELGLSVTNTDGSMKSLHEMMVDLRKAFGQLTPEQQASYAASLAGQEAMSGLLAIVNTSEEDFNKLTDAINNSSGAASEMERRMMDNLKGRLEELSSALEGVALQFYDAMKPALEAVTASLQKFVDWMATISPEAKVIIVVIAGIAAAIGPLLIVLGMLAGSIGAISTALPILGGAFAALTGPIGLIVAAIAGIGIALVALYKNNEEFRQSVDQIWGKIKTSIKAAIDQITEWWKEWGPSIIAIISPVWETIKTIFSTTFKVIGEIISLFLNVLTGDWKGALKDVSDIATLLWDGLKSIFAGIAKTLSGVWDLILKVAATKWNNLKTSTLSIVNSLKDGLLNIIQNIKNAFANMRIEIPKPKLPHVNVNWRSVGIGDAKVSIPDFNVNWYAKGTKFHPGGWAVVGEEGPELLKLPTGTQVLPNNKLNEVGGQSGETVITGNNFYIREDVDVEKVARELERLRRDKARGRGLAFA